MSKTLDILMLAGGALSGWLAHPILWPIGPFSFVARILATAAVESSYDPSRAGDNGESVGILQFKLPTWVSVGGATDDRSSPWSAGVASAGMVALAIETSPAYMLVYLPVLGAIYFRQIWRMGTASTPSLASAWSLTEPGYLPAYALWRVLGALIEIPLLLAFAAAYLARRGRR